jgi:DNA-binding XRE family transcriptional regulator
MSTQIIEKDGQPEYAVLPYSEYLQIVEAGEDKADLALYREAMAANEESIPAEVVNRLLDGESPVKVWREYRKLTQQDLATAGGVTGAYISLIESGQPASLKMMRAIAKRLNVTLSDLIDETATA